jgi:uncharacterized damage-inducible protein DinB
MDTPASKAELIQEMTNGRADWDAVLAKVPDSRMREAGVEGTWSVKQILAHICAYQQYMGAMLQDMKEKNGNATALLDSYYQMQLTMYRTQYPHIPEQLQDVRGEQVNEVFVAAYRFKTAAEVRAMEAESYRKLMEWIHAFSEEDLSSPFANTGKTLLQVVPRQSYTHYAQHIPAIETWLAKGGE